MEIITREHALALGLSRYFTGVACSRGNFHTRRASNGNCLCELCSKHRYDRHKDYYARWVVDNPEKARAPKLRYAAANVEKRRIQLREQKRANPAKVLADTRWRQTMKLNATPWWVDRKAIEAVFVEAKRLERETGIKHHVDHIVPLRGKGVCGLHVPWNLQAIPAKENYLKSYKHASNDYQPGVHAPGAIQTLPPAQATLGLYRGSSPRGQVSRDDNGSD